MEWTNDLSVGLEEIDSQHRELFRRINNLVDAIRHGQCKYVIDGTIGFLEDYARTHFSEEETWMFQHHYSDYEMHRAQHRIFLNALSDLKKQAAAPRVQGASYELSVATNQVVVDWILAHIVRIDKRLGEFLKTRM